MNSEPREPRRSRPALRVEHLTLSAYRNLHRVELDPGPRFNVIAGENGQGKSNLLEALCYLGALRSFRGAKKDDLIEHGQEEAFLRSRLLGLPPAQRIDLCLSRRRARRLQLDKKRPRSTVGWASRFPMVLFHPGHLSLVSGSPELRRSFLDRAIESLDATYAKTLAAYNKALRSRNRLLKKPEVDRRSVAAYEPLLASAGAIIAESRARFIEELKPIVERVFHRIAGQELPLSVRYEPRVEPREEAIRRALTEAYAKDRARGFTADGPHADDLVLSARQRSARHHASQGQHRMMALALKVAELSVLTRRSGMVPVLLLDDVSSELDRVRNERLFALLGLLGGQVFLTTTYPELIRIEHDRVDFRVDRGRLSPVDPGASGSPPR